MKRHTSFLSLYDIQWFLAGPRTVYAEEEGLLYPLQKRSPLNAFQWGKFVFQSSSCRRGQNPVFLLALWVDGKLSREASFSLALEKWKITTAPLDFVQRINCKLDPAHGTQVKVGKGMPLLCKVLQSWKNSPPSWFLLVQSWESSRWPDMQKETPCFFHFRGESCSRTPRKLCGSFGLTSSLLSPSLLVVGSMLQFPCNLESFGAYMNKWICLVLFPPSIWKTFPKPPAGFYVTLGSSMLSRFESSIVRHHWT